jgi:hypothetical protein
MAVIELFRKSRGGRASGPKSDLRVYSTTESGGNRYSIGIRVSAEVMKRMRWLVGDYVRASFDDATMEWSLRRVADESGNRLSSQGRKAGGDGTVRFAVDADGLKRFGLAPHAGYDCSLVSAGNDSACFKMC